MIDRETNARTLWLVGYGGWPTTVRAERLVGALSGRVVTRLVDVRLNPCASGLKPGQYGPKPWTLQAGTGAESGASGIVALLRSAGIAYEWMVELGNPQRHDPSMAVLREHLADPGGGWPVHRGLDRLAGLVRRPGEVVALLCACADFQRCHRTTIARALSARAFDGRLTIRDIRSGHRIDPPAGGSP